METAGYGAGKWMDSKGKCLIIFFGVGYIFVITVNEHALSAFQYLSYFSLDPGYFPLNKTNTNRHAYSHRLGQYFPSKILE